MFAHRRQSTNSRHSQRGVAAIMAALLMFSMVAFMALVTDTGRLYFEKRSQQKNTDLAALETATRFCRNQEMADWELDLSAENVMARNNYDGSFEDGGDSTINATLVDGNNVEVIVTRQTAPSLFQRMMNLDQDTILITTSATAKACDPIAIFTVGTRLANLGAGESVVGNLLSGIGLDLGLDLLDYNGLAGATITPGGLLEALGIPVSADLDIADFNALLAANAVSLGEILDATVELVGQDHLLSLNGSLLNELEDGLNVSLPDIQLGSIDHNEGLLAAVTSPVESALEVGIDALGLVSTAIEIATTNQAVNLDLAVLPSGLGGLIGADITAKVGIVEPPAIGMGGIGTKAYSAQTRVFTHIQLSSDDLLGGAAGGLLGNLLGTSIDVDLPLVIDVASATGEVIDLCTKALRDSDTPPQCPTGEDCATIDVDAQIGKICVGNVDPDNVFSTSESCDADLSSQQLLSVRLLGSNLISLNTHLTIDPLESHGQGDLAEQQAMTHDGQINIGQTVNNLTDALLTALLAEALNSNPEMTESQRTEIASEIWDEVNGGNCGTWDAACRAQKLSDAEDLIEDTSSGLQGFVAEALLNPVVGLLDSVLTLNIGGILGSVGNLLTGLLNGIGDLLGGLLVGNPCTGGGLLGGVGSNTGCIGELSDMLGTPSGQTQSNAVVFLTGLLLEVLNPVLDSVGNNLLTPILQDILGLQLGETEVNMLGLDCQGHSKLVQ